MSDIGDVTVKVRTLPDPELLEKMADADDATAEYLTRNSGSVGAGVPPDMVAAILQCAATARRKLAKDVRDGKGIRERHSTDG